MRRFIINPAPVAGFIVDEQAKHYIDGFSNNSFSDLQKRRQGMVHK